MKNIIIIISILLIPLAVYSFITKNADTTSAIAKDSSLPTLMTFSSAMCLDCQKMKAVIQDVKNDYNGKVNFVSINATENSKNIQDLIKKYNVTLVPTMIFADKEDNELKKIEGAISKEELTKELESLCNG